MRALMHSRILIVVGAAWLSGAALAGFCPLRNNGSRIVTSSAIRSAAERVRPERDPFEIITGNPIRNVDVEQRIDRAADPAGETDSDMGPTPPMPEIESPSVLDSLTPAAGATDPQSSFDATLGGIDERDGSSAAGDEPADSGTAAGRWGEPVPQPIPSPTSVALAAPAMLGLIAARRR